jgi:hypothetical protein
VVFFVKKLQEKNNKLKTFLLWKYCREIPCPSGLFEGRLFTRVTSGEEEEKERPIENVGEEEGEEGREELVRQCWRWSGPPCCVYSSRRGGRGELPVKEGGKPQLTLEGRGRRRRRRSDKRVNRWGPGLTRVASNAQTETAQPRLSLLGWCVSMSERPKSGASSSSSA